MIKGAQKQMIVIRTGDSRYFDEAYFVLRREIKSTKSKQDDMLLEANKILEEAAPSEKKGRFRHLVRNLLPFAAGILCGGAVAVLIFLLTH